LKFNINNLVGAIKEFVTGVHEIKESGEQEVGAISESELYNKFFFPLVEITFFHKENLNNSFESSIYLEETKKIVNEFTNRASEFMRKVNS
jgi:hypothetical protein